MVSQTRFQRVLLSSWPGLPLLWRGKVSGLVLALLFSWLVCLGLILTTYWPEWLRPGARTVVWLCVAGLWIATAAPEMVRTLGAHRGAIEVDSQGLFCLAQVEYLKGQWQQAERLLLRLLRFNADDGDARLMLATLYRHCAQWQRCRDQLDQLERSAEGAKWAVEIVREQQLAHRQQKLAMERESERTTANAAYRGASVTGEHEISEEAA